MRNALAIFGFFLIVIIYAVIFLFYSAETSDFYEIIVTLPQEMPYEGWAGIIAEAKIYSTYELLQMIENAPHYSQTRPSMPHPQRRMTDSERTLWVEDYIELGGINAQELELYKIINEIRSEHGLPPFILCPRLSMASRLFSYLQVKYHTMGHIDPYYDDLMERSNFFGAFGTFYMENANSQRWYVLPDGTIEYIYLSPEELVDGWMRS
ncbi:MAG: hypothetical protein FWF81_09005, partial [Defluviitaleaceae bacterium]|nr:hypothetical protein [Defluviitaleaceae bacterium]